MGFFLNSSRLLKDFRKKYNMPRHAMHLMQDYFWKVFHMHTNLICNLYAHLCWQKNYSCKKWVLHVTHDFILCP
jgi:hypothetical protein